MRNFACWGCLREWKMISVEVTGTWDHPGFTPCFGWDHCGFPQPCPHRALPLDCEASGHPEPSWSLSMNTIILCPFRCFLLPHLCQKWRFGQILWEKIPSLWCHLIVWGAAEVTLSSHVPGRAPWQQLWLGMVGQWAMANIAIFKSFVLFSWFRAKGLWTRVGREGEALGAKMPAEPCDTSHATNLLFSFYFFFNFWDFVCVQIKSLNWCCLEGIGGPVI